jgi:hypothetical protein
LQGVAFAGSFEIHRANASGVAIVAETAHALDYDLARAMALYLQALPHG